MSRRWPPAAAARLPMRWWISRSPAISKGWSAPPRTASPTAAMRLAARVALMLEIRQGGEPERLLRLPFTVRRAVVAQANAFAPEVLARRLPALLKLLVSTRLTQDLASASAFRALVAFAQAARRGAEG